jgi:hypothetical protein
VWIQQIAPGAKAEIYGECEKGYWKLDEGGLEVGAITHAAE